MNGSSPSGTAAVGSRLVVQYQVTIPSYPNGSGSGELRVPSAVATLPTASSALHVYIPATNLTIASGGNVQGPVNASIRLAAPTPFNSTGNASLATQGFAVLASWPVGTRSIAIRWGWVLEAPDGSVVTGPWSPSVTITPGELAWIAATPPLSISRGGQYPLCLSGPIPGRTFSVHFEIDAPFTTYSAPPVTVPNGTVGAFCWNTTIPGSLPAGTGFAHLWEYDTGTYLLYQLPFQVAGNSSTGTGSGLSPPLALVGIGAAAIGGAGAALFLGLRWMRGTRTASAGPSPAPPSRNSHRASATTDAAEWSWKP